MPADFDANFESLPVFDMREFILGESGVRQHFIAKLRHVCHNVGFFYIKYHGVSIALIEKMLTLTEIFFNLPQDEKDAIGIFQSPHYRGYGKLRGEITKGIPDYKETYDLGLEQPARENILEHPYLILQGPNQWPISLTLKKLQWKETILEYIAAMQKLGEQLMAAMSLVLGFPENYFVRKFCADAEDAYAILRLLRYPPGRIQNENQEPELGVGPHTDFGCLVFLLQDEVGGLQVQNCNGKWVDAPPLPGTFVVNIGEMLQIWSNNYFLATPHRVINMSSRVRHSVPFFFEPNLSTIVSPLKIAPEILATMQRPRASENTRVVYGEHMLNIYKRSFQSIDPFLKKD